jgi:hypothetical protein
LTGIVRTKIPGGLNVRDARGKPVGLEAVQ